MAVALIGLIVAVLAVVTIVGVSRVLRAYRQKAERAGFSSFGEYLRAAPRSDEEKKDAVDLALRGLVLCVLGLAFPPFLLIGIFPLYYGVRKVSYALMGFGLFEDADSSGA